LLHKLPCRPLVVFLGLYFLRGGIWEGKAGLNYCIMTSIYEYMIDCKVLELKHRSKNKLL